MKRKLVVLIEAKFDSCGSISSHCRFVRFPGTKHTLECILFNKPLALKLELGALISQISTIERLPECMASELLAAADEPDCFT